jgi:hypothetical protein
MKLNTLENHLAVTEVCLYEPSLLIGAFLSVCQPFAILGLFGVALEYKTNIDAINNLPVFGEVFS